MPILEIDTNVPELELPADFGIKTAELMADMFSTPINYSVVHLKTNKNIYWYGKEGNYVLGTMKILSIAGQISPEQNIKHAQIIVKHIVDNFKVPDKNVAIMFVQQEASNVQYSPPLH